MALRLYDGQLRQAFNDVTGLIHMVSVAADGTVTDLGAVKSGVTIDAPTVNVGNVGLVNAAETEINPATEDGNLATIKTNTDKLSTIDSDTGSIASETANISSNTNDGYKSVTGYIGSCGTSYLYDGICSVTNYAYNIDTNLQSNGMSAAYWLEQIYTILYNVSAGGGMDQIRIDTIS
jgi:hypothetical protein